MKKKWIYFFDQDFLQELMLEDFSKSVDELTLELPPGVYTTLRTVNKLKIFQFQYHLMRLVESFTLSKGNFPNDIEKIRRPLKQAIQNFPSDEVRIRLHIPLEIPNTCYIFLEELTVPSKDDYENGVLANTNTLTRTNPKAKLTSFIKKAENIKKLCKQKGLEESIIKNSQNELLEGLSSNFFAVKNEIIFTADKRVLSGATRAIILDEADKAKIKVILSPIHYDDLKTIQECFISSTSRGVLPIVRINNIEIANGKPGLITKFLMERFTERLHSEAENIA